MKDQMLANISNVKCYIDNVVIHFDTKKEDIGHVEKILSLLRYKGLRARLKKRHIMEPGVGLHGNYINKDL